MNSNRLILWDVDGTLLHCGGDGRIALDETFFRRYGIRNAFEKAPIGGTTDAMILETICRTFGIDPGDIPEIVVEYQKVLEDVLTGNRGKCVLPGVREILDAVESHPSAFNGLLTSNLRIGAETKLRSVGLDRYFRIGGFGDRLKEKWELVTDCIDQAEEEFQRPFSTSKTFLVGDSPYDVISAKKAGIKSVAVGTGWTTQEELSRWEPDHFFFDLSDTKEVRGVLGLDE